MTPNELLQRGRGAEALVALQAEVRAYPADARRRVFLFQLLAVLGQWERANTQLQVCSDLDPATLPMVQSYREALRCETLRTSVFAGKHTPVVFGQPDPWVAMMVEALRLATHDDMGRAAELQAQALTLAPASAGMLDGARFEWIADGDSRLGPILELIVNGHYYWVPFDRLLRVEIEPPQDLRDAVWTPVRVTFTTGAEMVGFIPTRYAGSESELEPSLMLARRTEWKTPAPGLFFGTGQRMFATDMGEYALMDCRTIVLEPSSGLAALVAASAGAGRALSAIGPGPAA